MRIALLTAFALLLAQAGALAHRYAHDSVRPVASATKHSLPAAHETCADCLGFAPLLFAAGTPAVPPAPALCATHGAAESPPSTRCDRTPRAAFRSRAPPTAA